MFVDSMFTGQLMGFRVERQLAYKRHLPTQDCVAQARLLD